MKRIVKNPTAPRQSPIPRSGVRSAMIVTVAVFDRTYPMTVSPLSVYTASKTAGINDPAGVPPAGRRISVTVSTSPGWKSTKDQLGTSVPVLGARDGYDTSSNRLSYASVNHRLWYDDPPRILVVRGK